MAAGPDEHWFTDAVWANPFSNNHKVLIYVAPVRREGRVVGVLYLEYDWEGQADEILRAVQRKALSHTTLSIVDRANRVVATTGSYHFEQALPLGLLRDEPHIETSEGKVVAQASAEHYHGFDGLGLRCVIEHVLPDATHIEAALRGE